MSLFTELMKAAYPHLSEGMNVAPYMRSMISRLCSVPEELWYTSRDKTPDEGRADTTLAQYYKRGLSKKLAREMLNNPTRRAFVDSLDYIEGVPTEAADEVKAALAESIVPFTDKEVNVDNVGDIFFDLIQESLRLTVDPSLEADRKLQRAKTGSMAAINKYGSRLLEDCKYVCSKPSCGESLQNVAPSGQSQAVYEAAHIAGNKAEYGNLVALCSKCFNQYVLGHKKAEEKELKRIKEIQERSAGARQTLSAVQIERGITRVVENLARANPKDFEPLNFDPVAVKNKIDEFSDFFLFDEVMQHVTRFFRFIQNQLKEQARLKAFDEELLRAQIKASYRKLADKKLDKLVIHDELSKRLSQITKQDQRYCSYVVSYFVQSCEVFDAATK